MFVTIVFFILPAKLDFLRAFDKDPHKRPTQPSPGLITWKTIHQKMHWSLIMVLGGGFAISAGSTSSKLSEMLGLSLSGLQKINVVAILVIVCLFAEVVTELTANVAVANIILPVLAEMVSKDLTVNCDDSISEFSFWIDKIWILCQRVFDIVWLNLQHPYPKIDLSLFLKFTTDIFFSVCGNKNTSFVFNATSVSLLFIFVSLASWYPTERDRQCRRTYKDKGLHVRWYRS